MLFILTLCPAFAGIGQPTFEKIRDTIYFKKGETGPILSRSCARIVMPKQIIV